MKKKSDAIYRAAALVGSMTALANHLGVRLPTVSQWGQGMRPVPVRHCVAIERVTGGAVTRQELRPNDYWLFWSDLPAPVAQEAQ